MPTGKMVYVCSQTQVLDARPDDIIITGSSAADQIYQEACKACRPAQPGAFVLVDADLTRLAQALADVSQVRVSIARRNKPKSTWSVRSAAAPATRGSNRQRRVA